MKHTILLKFVYAALLMAFYIPNLNAQGIISTWIGNGAAAYTGDGGAATAAKVSNPYGLCFDSSGNFYFEDKGNYAIRKVAASSGIITTIAGNGTNGFSGNGGPASSAVLGTLYSTMCTDESGNVYFSDGGNSVVWKINVSTGIITIVAGNGTPGSSGDGGLATNAQLYLPEGLCISSGYLYIPDHQEHRIRQVNLTTGTISTIAGNGTPTYTGDGGLAVSATLYSPSSVCADSSGNLYVADEGNKVVRKISASTGIISTVAGDHGYGVAGDAGPATDAEMGYIQGLCLDSYSNLYMVDAAGNCRMLNLSTGIINLFAGSESTNGYAGDGGPAIDALFNDPTCICMDPVTRNFIITDYSNNRIRKVTGCSYPYVAPIIGPHSACHEQRITLSDSVTGGTWTSSDTLTATIGSTSGIVTCNGLGIVTITYSVSNSCLTSVITDTITVNPYAGIITGADSVCVGDHITLINRVTGGTWHSANTTFAAISSTGLVTGLHRGLDTIMYIVADTCGSDTAYHLITIGLCGTGVNNISSPTTASIYPNPSSGRFSLQITDDQKYSMAQIFNIAGEKVYTMLLKDSINDVNLSDFPGGSYGICIQSPAGGTLTLKVIIAK